MSYEQELIAELMRLKIDNQDLRLEGDKLREQIHLDRRAAERDIIKILLQMLGSGEYLTSAGLGYKLAERFGISDRETTEWFGDQSWRHFETGGCVLK